MKKRIVAGSLLLLLGTCVALAQPTGKKSTASGVFTAAQAKDGERAFQAKCATCHGADLHSTEPEAPDLTEGGVQVRLAGKDARRPVRDDPRLDAVRQRAQPG
jgi:cytochrome c553